MRYGRPQQGALLMVYDIQRQADAQAQRDRDAAAADARQTRLPGTEAVSPPRPRKPWRAQRPVEGLPLFGGKKD